MQFLLTIAFAAIAASDLSGSIRRSNPVLVRAVVDGDTIDVATVGRVRLLGIDAPEIGLGFDTPAPFARESRERLAGLVLRRWVRLEYEGTALDAYNRRLAYVVREDGLFVNGQLVRDGLARVSARLPLTRLAELKRAEAEARTFRRGIWGSAPQIPVETYRTAPGRLARGSSGRYTAPSSHDASPSRRRSRARSPGVGGARRAGRKAAAQADPDRRRNPDRRKRRRASPQ